MERKRILPYKSDTDGDDSVECAVFNAALAWILGKMAAPGKQYGLIIPKKLLQKNVCLPKHSAFADDSDDELSVGESLQKESLKKRVMKQTKLEVQKALEEDKTVYEYDSVYDDIQKKKKEESAAKLLAGKDRKPKYIQNILKAVEVRKREQEKRMEKKIQKEREMEGDEFQDKEAFVTSAYKLKLQEKAEEEERERREAALEATLDVTKQKDLSGFYRHLLNQTVGDGQTPECSSKETEVKQEKPRGYSDEPNSGNLEDNIDADSDLGTESSDEEVKPDRKPSAKSNHSDRRERSSKTHDRHRHSSSSSQEQDDEHHRQKERYKGTSKEGRPEKDKHHSQRDYESIYRGEMEERPRYGEHGNKDRHRRREDHDSQTRIKDRRENESSNKDGRRDKRGHRKEEVDRYKEKDKERGKRHKERDDDEKRREGTDKDREHIDRVDRERTGRQDREHRERPDKDKDHRDLEKKERSPSPSEVKNEKISGSKHKVEETHKVVNTENNKFAKRSNDETLGSARDRYLARQMARAGNKTHVEKEED